MFPVSSGTNLPSPALQSSLKQNQCNIDLARVTKDTVSSTYREGSMTRLTPFLVKNLSAMVSAGPKTNREVKVSLCSEWTWKPRWICIALDRIPNKLTNVHNWNSWKHPPLHWKGCRSSSPSEALGSAPAPLPWLCGLSTWDWAFLQGRGKEKQTETMQLMEIRSTGEIMVESEINAFCETPSRARDPPVHCNDSSLKKWSLCTCCKSINYCQFGSMSPACTAERMEFQGLQTWAIPWERPRLRSFFHGPVLMQSSPLSAETACRNEFWWMSLITS